ncbi:putative transmembrane protein [Toxoplasma gondii VAND]|uniref:Putative transmembrane protein n=1 Tax=Toxoplasma gondii VAND TaxID=933077 RepID=A0A086PGC5_TOXGO|nr:putative transmembrane protein [Toxoplasma gondii VAND]
MSASATLIWASPAPSWLLGASSFLFFLLGFFSASQCRRKRLNLSPFSRPGCDSGSSLSRSLSSSSPRPFSGDLPSDRNTPCSTSAYTAGESRGRVRRYLNFFSSLSSERHTTSAQLFTFDGASMRIKILSLVTFASLLRSLLLLLQLVVPYDNIPFSVGRPDTSPGAAALLFDTQRPAGHPSDQAEVASVSLSFMTDLSHSPRPSDSSPLSDSSSSPVSLPSLSFSFPFPSSSPDPALSSPSSSSSPPFPSSPFSSVSSSSSSAPPSSPSSPSGPSSETLSGLLSFPGTPSGRQPLPAADKERLGGQEKTGNAADEGDAQLLVDFSGAPTFSARDGDTGGSRGRRGARKEEGTVEKRVRRSPEKSREPTPRRPCVSPPCTGGNETRKPENQGSNAEEDDEREAAEHASAHSQVHSRRAKTQLSGDSPGLHFSREVQNLEASTGLHHTDLGTRESEEMHVSSPLSAPALAAPFLASVVDSPPAFALLASAAPEATAAATRVSESALPFARMSSQDARQLPSSSLKHSSSPSSSSSSSSTSSASRFLSPNPLWVRTVVRSLPPMLCISVYGLLVLFLIDLHNASALHGNATFWWVLSSYVSLLLVWILFASVALMALEHNTSEEAHLFARCSAILLGLSFSLLAVAWSFFGRRVLRQLSSQEASAYALPSLSYRRTEQEHRLCSLPQCPLHFSDVSRRAFLACQDPPLVYRPSTLPRPHKRDGSETHETLRVLESDRMQMTPPASLGCGFEYHRAPDFPAPLLDSYYCESCSAARGRETEPRGLGCAAWLKRWLPFLYRLFFRDTETGESREGRERSDEAVEEVRAVSRFSTGLSPIWECLADVCCVDSCWSSRPEEPRRCHAWRRLRRLTLFCPPLLFLRGIYLLMVGTEVIPHYYPAASSSFFQKQKESFDICLYLLTEFVPLTLLVLAFAANPRTTRPQRDEETDEEASSQDATEEEA